MVGEIAVWFLVLSLFLPRIALLIAYFGGAIPPNNIPFVGDMLMAIFIPRVLILIYIVLNLGVGVWFWVHLVMAILVWTASISRSCNGNKK